MASTNEPNQNPNPPKFSGYKSGDVVRHNGWIWLWNGKQWDQRRRRSDSASDRQIQTARDYRREGPSGGGRETGQPGNRDDDNTGRSNSDNPRGTHSGGGGGGNGNGGGGGGGGGNPDNKLRGIPEGGKIWKVGNEYYLIYDVPKSGGQVQLAYKFRDKAEANSVSAGKGIKVSQTLTREQFRKTGAVPSGQVSLITNQSEHPWDRFVQDFRREAQMKPWLRDPDFMAVIAQSILENRTPTLAEIQSTDWYQDHTQQERDALEAYYGDRTTWNAGRELAKDKVEKMLIAAGYDEGQRDRVRNYFAREVMFGRLSDQDGSLESAIESISNPYATGAERTAGFSAPGKGRAVRHNGRVFWRVNGKDYRLSQFEQARFGAGAQKVGKVNATGGFGQFLKTQGAGSDISSVDNFNQVRQLVRQWLGPALMAGWGEDKIAQWAQKIKENPGAENDLVKKLRKIRAAKYQGYDEDLTYEDIAAIPRAAFAQWWGQTPDEKSDVFQQALQFNDSEAVGALLRKTGMQQGITKVVSQAESDAMKAFTSQGGIVGIGEVAG